MPRRAFTLIELLIVIAIIAVLAAILFPVFAQAKEAAKKSQSLSNAKQIGTALHLYVNDYDDVTPSTFALNNGRAVDVYQTLQPYLKSFEIFFSPAWTKVAPPGTPQACVNDSTPREYISPLFSGNNRCLGYGYNWGFGVWAGGALVGFERPFSNGRVMPGVQMTEADSPAQLFAFGDTYSGRRYTISAIGSLLAHYDGPKRNSALRHGGKLNFAYLDGHAKAISMQGYTFDPSANPRGTGYLAVPSDYQATVRGYCLTDDTVVKPANLGLPAPDMGCKAFIDLALTGALSGGALQKWPG